jgi:hypothetical protein
MAGGQLSLVAEGAQNIILTGNPTKTFWKSNYSQFTNFGKQHFRLDYEGNTTLRMNESSTFIFKVKRYADLLLDCYLSFDLPHIWSPILPPQEIVVNGQTTTTDWAPYHFKWIDNIGAQMIQSLSVQCGGQKIQEFSGQYLLAMVERDFKTDKKNSFNKMSGNIPELNDPANAGARTNAYPNAFYTTDLAGAEPSIRGRTLYIPLNAWFNLKTQMAFPLVALQNTELSIHITLRPLKELFKIRDVMDPVNDFPYIAPNFNQSYMQFHRFLQTPPDVEIGNDSYSDERTAWNTNMHLNCTYAFLDNDERKVFAENEQKYIFRQVRERKFYNVTGSRKVELDSIGLVANWMFYFQRSDANMRNEWSNRSNWPYNYLPSDLVLAPIQLDTEAAEIGPGINPDGDLTGMMTTNTYTPHNQKNILQTLGILLDGEYREDILPYGVFNYIEKYARTSGDAPDGLYCYNFCLDTSPFVLQPSGAMNMNRVNKIEFEFTTITPPQDQFAQTLNICDPDTSEIIGVNKSSWQLYDYNFDLTVMEERYNIVSFISGQAGLMFAT